jgi:RimJ/RimL family protein N-acetyltransferase
MAGISNPEPKLTLRRATEADIKLTFRWTNEPLVRQNSFQAGETSWESHSEWFRERLGDPNYAWYMGINDEGQVVGQQRFKIDGERAVSSTTMDPAFRGKGYGGPIIREGCRRLFSEHPEVKVVDGYVKTTNPAAIRATEQAGFRVVETRLVDGVEVVYFILTREDLK